MKLQDKIVFLVMISLSVLFAFAAVLNNFYQKQKIASIIKQHEIAARVGSVIGPNPDFKGDPKSPYTLVEFGDYQCPPCRETNRLLPSILNKYHGTLRLEFRNFPLTSIHPAAMPAAIAAEEARTQGKFWLMHDRLYQGLDISLDVDTVNNAINSTPFNQTQFSKDCNKAAKRAIESDIKEAESLGISGTPSFILCCPDGKVVHITSLEQLKLFLP